MLKHCIELNVKNEKQLIICSYNPHYNYSDTFMSELTTIVDKGLLDYDFITIIGDLNNNLLVTKSE